MNNQKPIEQKTEVKPSKTSRPAKEESKLSHKSKSNKNTQSKFTMASWFIENTKSKNCNIEEKKIDLKFDKEEKKSSPKPASTNQMVYGKTLRNLFIVDKKQDIITSIKDTESLYDRKHEEDKMEFQHDTRFPNLSPVKSNSYSYASGASGVSTKPYQGTKIDKAHEGWGQAESLDQNAPINLYKSNSAVAGYNSMGVQYANQHYTKLQQEAMMQVSLTIIYYIKPDKYGYKFMFLGLLHETERKL